MSAQGVERKLRFNAVTVMPTERPRQGRPSEFKTPNDVLQRTSSRREAAFFCSQRHTASRSEAAVMLAAMLMKKFIREPFTGVDLAARWTAVALIFSIPLSTAATSLCRVALLALWLCAGGFQRRMQSVGANLFNGFCLALLVVILLGTSYTISPAEIGPHLGKYSKLLYVPIALSLLDDARWRHRAITAFLMAMGITLLASMIHVVWPFGWAKSSLEGAVGNHYIFTNHIQQNVMMAAFAMLALHRARSAEARGFSWLWLAVAVLAMINIVFFVGSRTGHLALIVALFIYAGAAVPPRRRLVALMGVASLAALAVALSGNLRDRASLVAHEVATRSSDGAQTSSGLRVGFWIGSLTLIQRHPWLGTGTGSYEDAFCTVASSTEWCHHPSNGHPHNQAIHLWVENGLPGLIVFLGLLISPLWIAYRSLDAQRPVVYAFTAIFAVHSMLNASIYHIEGYFFLMLLCCLLGNQGNLGTSKTP